jgi:sterol desaturase/sphingolipid hydroxylase (fatty acid hydroxylase superfamily)
MFFGNIRLMEIKTQLIANVTRGLAVLMAYVPDPNRKISVGWIDAILDGIERMAVTKANHRAAFVADLGMCAGLFAASVYRGDMQLLPAITIFGIGLLLFSLVEYCFHRWLFHGPEHAMERGHRRHHASPLGIDSLPFFLPPIALLLLAGIFSQAMPLSYALLLANAIACGYFAYGQCHDVIHRKRFRYSWIRKWAANHHIHHHHPGHNFGVTSPLWDVIFGTRYVSVNDKKKRSK